MIIKKVIDAVTNIESLSSLILKDGFKYPQVVLALNANFNKAEIKEYFKQFIHKHFTANRIRVSNSLFYEYMFGKNISYFKESPEFTYNFNDFISKAVTEALKDQEEQFIHSNYKEMSLDKDSWVLFFMKGPSLNKREFFFSKIESSTLRHEVKLYFQHILKYEVNFRNDKGIALVTTACNYLTEMYPEISFFKDIKEIHIRGLMQALDAKEYLTEHQKPYAIESIRKMIQKCIAIVNFLIDCESYANRPQLNALSNITFNNTASFSKNTDIIPDEVISQLDGAAIELNPNHRLIYEILSATGLRFKEVARLASNCLETTPKSTDYMLLAFTPYKLLSKQKIKSDGVKSKVAISKELATKVQTLINATEDIRNATNTDYIFYTKQTRSDRFYLVQESAFVEAINRLITKYNICSSSGDLWHYTSRQSRKTLAVNLIEDGATISEVAMQLGHNDQKTTQKYYAEVRKRKLADMNSEFFKKRFKVFVGEENLKSYSEEERKELYVDFALNTREVEFGKCSKHLSEGPCGIRTGAMSCATCPKLCTGVSYIDKWIELVESQKAIVAELIRVYENEGIASDEYEIFVEYQKDTKLLVTYENVLKAINAQQEVS